MYAIRSYYGIRAIDAAMGEIGRARSRAPHAGTRSAEQRARYEQRLSSVESLLGVLRAREAAAPAPEGARAIDAAAARIDGARGVAEQGRLDEATSQLDAAEARITSYNVCYTKLLRTTAIKRIPSRFAVAARQNFV